MGDFNDYLNSSDKIGGDTSRAPSTQFQNFIDSFTLHNLQFHGYPFTWTNKQGQQSHTQEHIDWAISNAEWDSLFPKHFLLHEDYFGSDHRPLILNLHQLHSTQRHSNRFFFDKLWMAEPNFEVCLTQAWSSNHQSNTNNPIVNLAEKLKHCSKQFTEWKKSLGPSISSKIKEIQHTLKQVHNCATPMDSQLQRGRQLELDLDNLLYKEEEYWKQRSRIQWLKLGDKNTRYFHHFASSRRAKNKITALTCPDGSIVTDSEALVRMIEHHFEQLFTSRNPEQEIINNVLSGLTNCLSEAEFNSLSLPYNDSEIKRAAFQLASDKAPGSDGYNGSFFQKNWHIVGTDVLEAAKGFLNGDANIEAINHTVIVLIPKLSNPQMVTDYRPISLCSTLYKIISRVLVNRLKPILSRIISPAQSAFLPHRLISDNIIIGQEIFHALSHRTSGKHGWMAIKLDMAKAFDRVEWNFIKQIMTKLNFPHRFINLVMACISTVSFSFSINQQVLGRVTPSRGIRQGDPLSPYLFLLCSEGLSSLISQKNLATKSRNNGLGLKIARNAPIISHLFFADDSLLFSPASSRSANTIKEVLHAYCSASGQMVNYNKSSLFFSPNTDEDTKYHITSTLGIPVRNFFEKYLGLPQTFGRTKKEIFNYLSDRAWSHLNKWNSKHFSKGGKEILLKSVVQEIPSYAMACFKLPASFHSKIESMMAQFWWGGSESSRKIHWKKWEILHAAASSFPDSDFQFFLCLVWKSWHCRNEFLHHQKRINPALMIQSTSDYLNLYQQNNMNSAAPGAHHSLLEAAPHGELPNYNLKLTVDAAQDIHSNMTGFGLALFNSEGNMLLSVSKPWTGTHSALQMEAHALTYALSW
uniref:Reverse transcriptase domain-containing protein n=1 Tax=Cannabis sativa TaxID=3483 RepID=A0A803PJY6_CANSA